MINITFVGRPVPGQTVTVIQNGKSVTVRNPIEAVTTPAVAPVATPAQALVINDPEAARLLLAAAIGNPNIDVVIRNDEPAPAKIEPDPESEAEPEQSATAGPAKPIVAVETEAEEAVTEADIQETEPAATNEGAPQDDDELPSI